MTTGHRRRGLWCLGLVLAGATAAALGAGLGCGGNGAPKKETPDLLLQEEDNVPTGPPFFKDITAASGVSGTFRNGEEKGHLAIPESLGGGVGLFDFDGDGLLDLFVVGGGTFAKSDEELGRRPRDAAKLEQLLRTSDRSCALLGYPCKLYRNLGGRKFQDVTDQALRLDGDWFYTHGCAAGDYDRDGWTDLLVTGWGRLALFHNEPDPTGPARRRLVDVTRKAGLMNHSSWSSSAGFGDLDGDGFPDLYVCYYGDWSWKKHPLCQYDGVTDDVCPPKNFFGLPHKLFKNNKDGTFSDVTQEVGLRPGGEDTSKGLGVLLVDLNLDGRPDVYVANDTVDNFLYFNVSKGGKLALKELGFESGTARDDKGGANGSMGLDCADYDGTGLPHLFVTNYEGEKHALYHNDFVPGKAPEEHFFSYKTSIAKIAAIGQTYVGWGTAFVDLDHKGWEDLIIFNGHAIHKPTGKGAKRDQRPVLLRNQGDGTFANWTPRGGEFFQKPNRARGLAAGDIDNDGRVDAVVSHVNTPVAVLHNVADTAGNHWLGVELVGKEHRDVVGARISLEAGGRTQWRFAKGGGSYASARDPRHVFGLGKEGKAGKLTVHWPDGTKQEWTGLGVGAYYRLTQGKAEAEKRPARE